MAQYLQPHYIAASLYLSWLSCARCGAISFRKPSAARANACEVPTSGRSSTRGAADITERSIAGKPARSYSSAGMATTLLAADCIPCASESSAMRNPSRAVRGCAAHLLLCCAAWPVTECREPLVLPPLHAELEATACEGEGANTRSTVSNKVCACIASCEVICSISVESVRANTEAPRDSARHSLPSRKPAKR